jgi:hypothetical protein
VDRKRNAEEGLARPLETVVKTALMVSLSALLPLLACSGPAGTCGPSLCGCAEDATLNFVAHVQDVSGAPVPGAEGRCAGESAPVATAGTDGVISFTLQTQKSPGCGFVRCNTLHLSLPSGTLQPLDVPEFQANGATVTLCPAGQSGGGVHRDAGVTCF